MRFGLSLPNLGVYADVRALADLAHTAEAAGWDGVFLWDSLHGDPNHPVPVVDPWVALTAIALVRAGRFRGRTALAGGKGLVTANKAMIAHHGLRLAELLDEIRSHAGRVEKLLELDARELITVRRGAMGSFRLVSERGGAGHRVRREQ